MSALLAALRLRGNGAVAERHRGRLRIAIVTGALAFVAASLSCDTAYTGGGDVSHAFACPKGTSPCGDGCIPGDTSVCCDNGSRTTSSYCTNSAGGACVANTMHCAAAFPLGANAQFCCSQNGTVGSNDCPSGQ